jgi:hypothetical protein
VGSSSTPRSILLVVVRVYNNNNNTHGDNDVLGIGIVASRSTVTDTSVVRFIPTPPPAIIETPPTPRGDTKGDDVDVGCDAESRRVYA